MNKAELSAVIASHCDLTKEKAHIVHHGILDAITGALAKDTVTLVGFGTFEKRHRGARTKTDPQTGETVQIAAGNTIAFKPGKNLRESLNGARK
ncbi:HU family DNA-binding protein [Streptomyces goshikiensis]|uniref:HU family DNA-binding protein n=1 Tax=Streptomyces goshikiensis TaxID=1942 RepID=UPI003405ED04